MMYQYNFGFLEQWLEANPAIQKGAVQQALGVKSNNGLNSWIRKEGPMSVISMLRFCNSFQVPLSAFFRDIDAGEGAAVVPGRPNVNDQLEPDGGYATDAGERKQGERTMLDPTDVTITPSVVPGAVVLKDIRESNADREWHEGNNVQEGVTNTEQGAIESKRQNGNSAPIMIGNVSDANMKALIDMEMKHNEQRNRLLDIIEEQQKQIADLTRMLERLKRGTYTQSDYIDDGRIGMVAEDSPLN